MFCMFRVFVCLVYFAVCCVLYDYSYFILYYLCWAILQKVCKLKSAIIINVMFLFFPTGCTLLMRYITMHNVASRDENFYF